LENFEKKKIQLTLNGFSGNIIQAYRIKDCTVIRKTSANKIQNEILNLQLIKLKELVEISKKYDLFKIPKIISSGYDNNERFYYELEFIPAENLDSALIKFNSQKISEISKVIYEIIKKISSYNSPQNKNEGFEHNFILNKFNETTTSLNNKKISFNLTKNLIEQYTENIKMLDIKPMHIVNTEYFCHGDLALDNILITRDNKIYLIDPLKNSFENTALDYSKILQSSMTQWNLIKHNNFELLINERKIKINPNTHASLFHNHFLENLNKNDYGRMILYLGLTMARVTKYAKNEKQLCALILITNELLSNYNDRRYDLNGSLSSLRG
jgi:thiamine kinase-like enzyme